MASTYRLTPIRRFGNFSIRLSVILGVGPRGYYLLHVRGRRSGRIYSTPVHIIDSGARYLVAPYGEVGWVKNLRATGEVALTRGFWSGRYRAVEVGPREAAPVLQTYLPLEPVTRPFFDAKPNAPLEAFQAEAPRHPVFRLVEQARGDRP